MPQGVVEVDSWGDEAVAPKNEVSGAVEVSSWDEQPTQQPAPKKQEVAIDESLPIYRKQETAIPKSIANPVKNIAEKIEKKDYPAFAGGEEKNPYANVDNVVNALLEKDPRLKSDWDYSNQIIRPDAIFENDKKRRKETQLAYEKHSLYEKGLTNSYNEKKSVALDFYNKAQDDINRIQELSQSLNVSQTWEGSGLNKIPKDKEGNYLISTPEQQQAFDKVKAEYEELNTLNNKPDVQEYFKASQNLKYAEKLIGDALKENKTPELPFIDEAVLSLKGSFIRGLSNVATDIKADMLIKMANPATEDLNFYEKGALKLLDVLPNPTHQSPEQILYDVADTYQDMATRELDSWMPRSQMPIIDESTGQRALPRWGDREMYTQTLPQTVGSFLSLYAPAIVSGATMSMLVPEAPTGWSLLARSLYNVGRGAGIATGAALANRPLESMMESGGIGEELSQKLMEKINPVTSKPYTENEALMLVHPYMQRIEDLNNKLVYLDALQFAIALTPVGKAIKWAKIGKSWKPITHQIAAMTLSSAIKLPIEGHLEGVEERDFQGLWTYQQKLVSEGKLTQKQINDDFWIGHEEWVKTPEAQQSYEQGAVLGAVLGGFGVGTEYFKSINSYITKKNEILQGADDAVNIGRNAMLDISSEAAVMGLSHETRQMLKESLGKLMASGSKEDKAEAEQMLNDYMQMVDTHEAMAKGMEGMDLSAESKKSIILLTEQGKMLEQEKQAYIAEKTPLVAKGFLSQEMIDTYVEKFDKAINKNKKDIQEVTKIGIELYAARQKELQAAKDKFALPIFPVDTHQLAKEGFEQQVSQPVQASETPLEKIAKTRWQLKQAILNNPENSQGPKQDQIDHLQKQLRIYESEQELEGKLAGKDGKKLSRPEQLDVELHHIGNVAAFEGELHPTNPIQYMDEKVGPKLDVLFEDKEGLTDVDLKNIDDFIWKSFDELQKNKALSKEERAHSLNILSGLHEDLWAYNDKHLLGINPDQQTQLTENKHEYTNETAVEAGQQQFDHTIKPNESPAETKPTGEAVAQEPEKEVKKEFKPIPKKERKKTKEIEAIDQSVEKRFPDEATRPGVKDLMSGKPEEFDVVLSMMKNKEEFSKKDKSSIDEVKNYVESELEYLDKLLVQPGRIYTSEQIEKARDILEKALDTITKYEGEQNLNAVAKEKAEKEKADKEAKATKEKEEAVAIEAKKKTADAEQLAKEKAKEKEWATGPKPTIAKLAGNKSTTVRYSSGTGIKVRTFTNVEAAPNEPGKGSYFIADDQVEGGEFHAKGERTFKTESILEVISEEPADKPAEETVESILKAMNDEIAEIEKKAKANPDKGGILGSGGNLTTSETDKEKFASRVKAIKKLLGLGARSGFSIAENAVTETMEKIAKAFGETVEAIKKAFEQAVLEYKQDRGYNKQQAGHFNTAAEREAAEKEHDAKDKKVRLGDELFRIESLISDNAGNGKRQIELYNRGLALLEDSDATLQQINEFKQRALAEVGELKGVKNLDKEILESMGLSEEEAEFLSDESAEAASFNYVGNAIDVAKVQHVYSPRNENGELVGIKDDNGEAIPQRKVYQQILDHVQTTDKYPENFSEFFAKMPNKKIGAHLEKQSEGNLESLFRVMFNTVRERAFHLSVRNGVVDLQQSNKLKFDFALENALVKLVENKFTPEQLEKNSPASRQFTSDRNTLSSNIGVVQSEISKLSQKFDDLNREFDNAKTNEEKKKINDQKLEVEKSSIPLFNKITALEATFLNKYSGIAESYWKAGGQELLNSRNYFHKTKDNGQRLRYIDSRYRGFLYGPMIANNLSDFIKNLTVPKSFNGQEEQTQIKSLLKAISSEIRNEKLEPNFVTINGKTHNADIFNSSVDIRIKKIPSELRTNKELQKNRWANKFTARPPKIAFYEGETIPKGESATVDGISDRDLTMAMFQHFINPKALETGRYWQFMDQQKDNTAKMLMEAPIYTIEQAKAILKLLGPEFEAIAKKDYDYVRDQLMNFNKTSVVPLKFNDYSLSAKAQEFAFNYVINKHYIDQLLQPQFDKFGKPNWKSYDEKVKRAIIFRGAGFNNQKLEKLFERDHLRLQVAEDPKGKFALTEAFDEKDSDITDGMYFVRDKSSDKLNQASGSLFNLDTIWKLSYSNHDENNSRTLIKGMGVKLTESTAKMNSTYQKIYDYMEANDIDVLAFSSSAKKHSQDKIAIKWGENGTVNEMPAMNNKDENVIQMKFDYLLNQQDLRQKTEFTTKKSPRQMFYYMQRFPHYGNIQKIMNDLVAEKTKDFIKEYGDATLKEKKRMLSSMLEQKSDKYDEIRKYLNNESSGLTNPKYQGLIRSLVQGYVRRTVLEFNISKQISVETPLLGTYDNNGTPSFLKPMRIEKGKIKPAQALVPHYLSKTHKKGDIVLIARVPGTELHSMTPVQIVGFLDEDMGNQIMTDQGTRKMAGSDYDGDQRHIWGKFRNEKTGEDITTGQRGKINEIFDLILGDYMAVDKEGKSTLSGQELTDHFNMITAPIRTDLNKGMVEAHQKRINKSADARSLKSYVEKAAAAQNGGKTIGIGARFNAVFNGLEKANARLHNDITIPNFKTDENGKVTLMEGSTTLGSFSEPNPVKRLKIHAALANYLNHSTDNSTHGRLDPMGFTQTITPLGYLLTSLGMEEEQVYNFTNHPLVRKYSEYRKENSSPYNKQNKKETLNELLKSFDTKFNPKDLEEFGRYNIEGADIISEQGTGAVKFIALLNKLMQISDTITSLATLEKVQDVGISNYAQYINIKKSIEKFKDGIGPINYNGMEESNYLINTEKALEMFEASGKDVYPVFTKLGELAYNYFTASVGKGDSMMQLIKSGGLESAINKQFLINAMNITDARADIAAQAKEVYDNLEEDSPLKKLLKWDKENNRLSTQLQYQNYLNDAEKNVFRKEFEALRELNSLQGLVNTKTTKKDLQEIAGDFIVLLKHQILEYGWGVAPKSGEYSSFMDLGTELRISKFADEQFKAWNNIESDEVMVYMAKEMLRQMQLSNTNLMPLVTAHNGQVLDMKGNVLLNNPGYAKIIDKNGEAKIYSMEDLYNEIYDKPVDIGKKYQPMPMSDKVKEAMDKDKAEEQEHTYKIKPTFTVNEKGYAARTMQNASADATLAIAVDFNTDGEEMTKSFVKKQNKALVQFMYAPVTPGRVKTVVDKLNKANAKTLNIAGNGIYTFDSRGINQTKVDNYVFDLLSQVVNHPDLKNKIESIRTGGQTGVDEAGAKAGMRLGIPTEIHAPAGWMFKNKLSQDISNEQKFKERFGEKAVPVEKEVVAKKVSEKINIYAGTNENTELSNFAVRPFTLGTKTTGVTQTFKTVEGAFQAAKLGFTNHYLADGKMTAEEKLIMKKLEVATGAEAKSIGKNIKDLNRKEWDKVSSARMLHFLQESFKQNPKALEKLLATGNAELTHTQDKSRWGTKQGDLKTFPELLMEVREEFSKKAKASESADVSSPGKETTAQATKRLKGAAKKTTTLAKKIEETKKDCGG